MEDDAGLGGVVARLCVGIWPGAHHNSPPSTPAPSQQETKPNNPQAAPLTLESAPPPVNAEEEAAFKAYNEISNDDAAKKDQAGDRFPAEISAKPLSHSEVYSWQVRYYFSKGQIDKMEVAADKELELYPNDAQTLAIVGSALPRAMNASTPDPQKRLAKAEQYSQKALDLMPTLPKPDNMTDEAFTKGKNMTTAMAYSGLGLVAFRRGKFADAIPNFEKSVQTRSAARSREFLFAGNLQRKDLAL